MTEPWMTPNDPILEAVERDRRLYGVGAYEQIRNADGTVTLRKLTLEEARKLQEDRRVTPVPGGVEIDFDERKDRKP